MKFLTYSAIQKPKLWFAISAILSLLLIVLVALPSLIPEKVPFLNPLHIDTDPENMLNSQEPVRVYHNEMKHRFDLHDIVVVGVVAQEDGSVFTPETLADIYTLTEYAKTLQWKEKGELHGVVASEMMAPSTVDNIEQASLGSVRFEWLMGEPPYTEESAQAVAQKAKKIPLLNNTLISGDGKSLALYIPIYSKNDSYEVAEHLREKTETFKSNVSYMITGLPVAQDQFGVEMFKQMAIAAPMAMGLIFALMWYFFRNTKIVIAPLIVALVSVIVTMSLLIITGNTLHIMSSMIPIFIMPIAVLDAIHILSDFFDRYPKFKNKQETITHVMKDLGKPMLFTTLTTCAGFASLAFTPIPPVQVFGIFIAIGVLAAWLFTVTLIPAYIILMSEQSLKNFGHMSHATSELSRLARFLHATGRFTYRYPKTILALSFLAIVIAVYGILQIQINDNPVKWFEPNHEIRVADRALNQRFSGTYMAYLTLGVKDGPTLKLNQEDIEGASQMIQEALKQKIGEPIKDVKEFILAQQDQSEDITAWNAWDAIYLALDKKAQGTEIFKQPEALNYIENLQDYLIQTGLVGKSNGITDIIKTVHRELLLGEPAYFSIPDTSSAVAQTLITYESSHRPQDLWHFVTPDYKTTNLWIQLKSGDNKDMQAVVDALNTFTLNNPAPNNIEHKWFGLTYINVIWQNRMVAGMVKAFAGSFVIVLIMMVFLFRSLLWGLISMIPLTITIGFIYGVIGIIGKDYDMPVAVLSSLSIGLAIDYAIHFIARSREIRKRHVDWKSSVQDVFSEPARAIFRNVAVIGIGFLPLLAAPLIPYQTVGIFISSILLIAGAASLLILPAIIKVLEKYLF